MKYFKRKCTEWRDYLDVAIVLQKLEVLKEITKDGE